MFFHRSIEAELLNSAKEYPIVTLMGPRQSGKTTLAQALFEDKPYINLEAPDIRRKILADPRAFLNGHENGAILDEIQRAPELLSYLQVRVDEQPKKGLFILTGSHQLELHQAVSQSLAGRTALHTLLPLSLSELKALNQDLDLDETLIKGGYPRIYHDNLDPTKAHRNYLQTYIERDLRQLINVKDLLLFQKFLQLCAGRIGQVLNYDSLASDTGVSAHTVKNWISVLEASFVVFRLTPYFENFGKRVIKSPKLYFNDTGLAIYLLGIENKVQLNRDPLRGNLFENLVVLELLKYRLNQGLEPKLFFFRDTHGHEVDLIVQLGRELIPVEIKVSQTFHPDFLNNILFFKKQAKDRCQKSFLIYSGSSALNEQVGDTRILNYLDVETIFSSQF